MPNPSAPLHRALQRQLKKCLHWDEANGWQALQTEVARLDAQAYPQLHALVAGLDGFLQRVDGAYQQSDRDLDLRSRSLELSSDEMMALNQRLSQELAERQLVLASLNDLVAQLKPEASDTKVELTAGEGSMTELSDWLRTMLTQRAAYMRRIEEQQFALDQHAIVSMTDLAGNISYVNEKFCAISGYEREELMGRNHRVIKSGLHPKAFYEELWSTVAEGRVWQGEVCNRRKNGELYWVAATVVPLLDAQGLPERYISIRTDITQRKQAEKSLQEGSDILRRAKEAAESANRAKSDFLANMSHEIRTPMNGIIGMCDLAMDTPLDEEQHEYLQIIKSSSEALLTIINDILDFSKIEAGKLEVERVPLRLGRLISDTLRVLGLRAHHKGLELLADVPPDPAGELLGDPGRIRQVLVNLVGNAIKFTHHGEIVVEVDWGEQAAGHLREVRLTVRDTGIGIPLDKQAEIFDAFSQEDTSTTRHYGGTGLGLSITRRLVELMGGRIWLDSEPGQGSAFHFTLQLGWQTGHTVADEPQVTSLQGLRMLVVDDNATNRTIYQRLLQRWGAVADVAEDGPHALQALAQQRYDLAILDSQMPGMDGFEVAQTLRDHPPPHGVPVLLMLSSAGLGAEAQRGRELGFAGHYAKPMVSEDLFQALVTALQGRKTNHLKPGQARAGDPLQHERALNVLLVEDQEVNQKLALTLLKKWGHRATLAVNGEEGVRAAEAQEFDLVLMDVQMPVLDGLEATRRIRAMEARVGRSRVPIIAMTANAMVEDQQIGLDAGMDDYIAKPINARSLFERLATVV